MWKCVSNIRYSNICHSNICHLNIFVIRTFVILKFLFQIFVIRRFLLFEHMSIEHFCHSNICHSNISVSMFLNLVSGIMPHCIDGQTLDNVGSDFCFFDGKNWEKEIKLKEEFVSKMSKEK